MASINCMESSEKQEKNISSRILFDVECKVCSDNSSGKHYGIFACDGCAGFFKRSIRRNRIYVCKSRPEGSCTIDKSHRNQCRACRLKRCEEVGMNRESVQNERGPRNAALKSYMMNRSDETVIPATSFMPFPSLSIHQAYQRHLSVLNEARIAAAMATRSTCMTSPTTTSSSGHSSPICVGPPSPASSFTSELSPETISFSSSSSSSSPVGHESVEKKGILELAARLVLMNIRWSRFVPNFSTLSMGDQTLLLEESWRELFVLSAAQFNLSIDEATLTDNHADACAFASELRNLRESILRFQQLGVDPTEFACLRAIVLFKTSLDSNRDLKDSRSIGALQDLAQITLAKYVETAYPTQPSRFGKLLLLLPTLKSISSHSIEDLFFRSTVGSIAMEKIIVNSYLAQN